MKIKIGEIYFLGFIDSKTGEKVKRHPIVVLRVNALKDEVEISVTDEVVEAVRGTSNLNQRHFPGILVEPSAQNGLKKKTIFHLSPPLKFKEKHFEGERKAGDIEEKYISQLEEEKEKLQKKKQLNKGKTR